MPLERCFGLLQVFGIGHEIVVEEDHDVRCVGVSRIQSAVPLRRAAVPAEDIAHRVARTRVLVDMPRTGSRHHEKIGLACLACEMGHRLTQDIPTIRTDDDYDQPHALTPLC